MTDPAAAHLMLTAWSRWAEADAPCRPPGNHWGFAPGGYRSTPQNAVWMDSEKLCRVDEAVSSLRSADKAAYRSIKRRYMQGKWVDPDALEKALRAFCVLLSN